MAQCKHCAQPAGFLRLSHAECRQKNQQAKKRIQDICRQTMRGSEAAGKTEVDKAALLGFVSQEEKTSLILQSWENALESALADSLLTQEEQAALDKAAEQFGLSRETLDRNGALTKAQRAMLLREVVEGRIPPVEIDGYLPFLLQKSEKLAYVFTGVDYYQQKKIRQFKGRSAGVSVRVAKGLYFRTGGFRGGSESHIEDTYMDEGIMALTTKHLYFAGENEKFRIRYDKMMAIEPCSSGIVVQKDGARAKPMSFLTYDEWFTYNLIRNLAMGPERFEDSAQ